MEVTADNFHEVLPVVEKAIDDATFVAIDGEFTGLSLGTEGTPQNAMDTADERYAKVQLYIAHFALTFQYPSRPYM